MPKQEYAQQEFDVVDRQKPTEILPTHLPPRARDRLMPPGTLCLLNRLITQRLSQMREGHTQPPPQGHPRVRATRKPR